jgi:hypothetical protein
MCHYDRNLKDFVVCDSIDMVGTVSVACTPVGMSLTCQSGLQEPTRAFRCTRVVQRRRRRELCGDDCGRRPARSRNLVRVHPERPSDGTVEMTKLHG